MKRLILPFIIILIGFGLAFLLIITGPKLEPQPRQSLAPLVRIITVNPAQVALSTFTHGTVAPRTESELVPEVSGRIIEMSPAMVSGGFFKQGDSLIQIDPLDYELALKQTKAGITRAESDLTNAKRSYQRQLNLAKKQSISASQRDDAYNRLRIAEATFDEAKAKLSRASRDLKRTQILAPYDGRVRTEKVDAGQFVSRGTPIATIYAIDYAEVSLPIHDEELAYLELSLKPGEMQTKAVAVTLRARFAGKDEEWQGHISRTEGELDRQTHMINVVARVARPYDQAEDRAPLSVGLFVEAEIHGSVVDNIVVLPRLALRDMNQVYVVDADNKLQFRSIEILRIVDDRVYVSAGLSAGDRVCISRLGTALEGMSVRIQANES